MPENSHPYNVCTLTLKFLKLLIVLCIVSKPDRDCGFEKNGPPKGPLGKTGPQGLKTLSFFSSNTKGNVEVIHFHIKSRGVQGLAFVQITFENCTLNFYFEQRNLYKKDDYQFAALISIERFRMFTIFMQPRFK